MEYFSELSNIKNIMLTLLEPTNNSYKYRNQYIKYINEESINDNEIKQLINFITFIMYERGTCRYHKFPNEEYKYENEILLKSKKILLQYIESKTNELNDILSKESKINYDIVLDTVAGHDQYVNYNHVDYKTINEKNHYSIANNLDVMIRLKRLNNNYDNILELELLSNYFKYIYL